MWKKLLILLIAFMSMGCAGIAYYNFKMEAAGNNTFTALTISQYSKLQLAQGSIYTAINTSGSYLSDTLESNQPVYHTTAVTPVEDTRVSSFITDTRIPSYSDILPAVSANHLNNAIPFTDTWWLSDITTINDTKSARIVNQNNNIGDDDYLAKHHTRVGYRWQGYLPIEDHSFPHTNLGKIYNTTEIDVNYNKTSGSISYLDAFPGAVTVEVCVAVIENDTVLPCNDPSGMNPSTTYTWNHGTGLAAGKATLDPDTRTIHTSILDNNELHPGDLIVIGELCWPTNNFALRGSTLMVVGGNSTNTIQRTYLYPFDITAAAFALDGTYFAGTEFADLEAKAQKARLRKMIQTDQSKIAYVSTAGSTITNNQFQSLLKTTQAGTAYIAHLFDSSLAVNGLRENESGAVKVEASQNTIKIPKGTTKIQLPVNTSPINGGYTRYISVLANNKSNQQVFGKIGSTGSANATLSFDVSNLIDTNTIGATKNITLYAEDIDHNGTSYISSGYDVKLEIVDTFDMTYQPKASSYEYDKNVYENDCIGDVTIKNGIQPYTLKLTDDSGSSGAYQYFELDQTSNITSNTVGLKVKPATVKINNNTNSLQAGEYKLCIVAKDDSGSGDEANPEIKKCIDVKVKKAQPTITFDHDDKGTTYVSGSTTATTSHSEHATHTNKDSSNDAAIEYSYISGNSSILSSGLPFTSVSAGDQANIVFAANVSGSIIIQAKIPESDNYEAATTTKTLTLQLGIVANYVEDKTNIKAGSSEAKPPTTYAQANRIGHIDVQGGITPYSYSLPSGKGNNGSFHIDSSGNIYVNQSVGSGGLTPGDYEIEVEVKDSTSPTKQSATVKKKITVGAATLSGVGWEDPNNAGHALASNTYEITYDPSGEPNNGGTFNTKLIETTSGSLASTVIQYSLDPDPNDVLSIGGTSTVSATVNKASDSATLNNVKIKAHISGGIYGSIGVDTELIVNVKKYPQTIAFDDTDVLKLPVGGACVSVPASVTSAYSKSGETISYTSSNTNSNAPFTINASGDVCPTSNASDAGSATLTGTLQGDDNYETAVTQTGRVIQVYVPGNIEVTGSIDNGGTSGVTYTPDSTLKKALHTSASPNGGTAKNGVSVAHVNASGSTYTKSANTGNENADANYFNVTATGYITLKQDITADDLNNHGTGNKYYIQVDVKDKEGNIRTVDVIIVIEDAQADFYFVDPIQGTKLSLSDTFGTVNVPVYTATYSPSGTLDVQTSIDAAYSEVTVAEASGIPIDEDVIDHNNLNQFTILNASDPIGDYGSGGDAYVKACMNAQDGYAAQCIYAKVVIEKAEQDDFAFVHQPKWIIGKDPTTIQPTYNGKLSSGDVMLSSNDNTIAEALPPVSGQDQSFKTKGKVGTATLTATAPEDRNYNAKQATTILETTEKPPTTLTLFVPGMTYGDSGIEAKISTGYKSGVPAYFYVDDTSILTVDSSAVNSKISPPITAIGSGQVIVKVCQTDQPFDPATDDCNAIGGDYGEQIIIVQKKPLTLTYQDETIYVGESFPKYQFIEPDASAFAFTDSINDFPIPKNTSAKDKGTALKDTMKQGIYDISGSYGSNELSGNTQHYEIKLQSGKLTIKQDEAQINWYHLEDPDGNTVSADDWHNTIVDVVIDSANAIASAGTYDQISDTINFTNADKERFTVTKEDDNLTDIYFRIDPNGSDPHKGAISDKLQDHVKIDMTEPKIVSITGYPVNTDGVSNLLNEITLGHYFKPGVQVEIKTEDPQPAGSKTVKISGVKEVSYQIYELDDSGNMTRTTPITMDTSTPGSNNILSFKINEIGNYRVCATVIDNATNESSEKCSDLNIKKIDIDVDGDGEPDFNDPDGDGCPDLNIKWKDPSDPNKWIVINGDRDYDGIPDLNIDSDGDGKADLNVDTDNDGKPDLNLVMLKKSDWRPTRCVKKDVTQGILEEYCTGITVKPIINVDIDGDNIPDINIDNQGDFKPHLNISKDDKTPYLNIIALHEWKPKKDYKSGKFAYDSIGKDEVQGEINIDTDGDGYPDLNLDLDGDGEPDLNIDLDGDGIPDIDIDSTGDGKPDVNIDSDGDGKPDENIINITEWKPDKNIDGEMPYDTMSNISEPQDPSNDDPNQTDEPTEPKDDDNNATNYKTDVQGNYNPASSMGGAETGDSTNLMYYISLSLFTSGILCFLLYKNYTKRRSRN